MSEIKVNSIKGVGASTAAISIDNSSGTCTANLTNRNNKNLVINGACLLAQRGSQNTTGGYLVDRFTTGFAGQNEAITQSQVDVGSGTTPYSLGFRKALRLTNGNQSGGADTGDYVNIQHKIEAQDMATSGWNYTSSSSYISLSFWIKSSVSQKYYVRLFTTDGTAKAYVIDTGVLSANTWTKITHEVAGHADLQFDMDADVGFTIQFVPFYGTAFTDSSVSIGLWGAKSGTAQVPDMTSTWWTTDDATFEITGFQIEVSDHSTDFEHLSEAVVKRLCQRYYQQLNLPEDYATGFSNSYIYRTYYLPVEQRANGTGSVYSQCRYYSGSSGANFTPVILPRIDRVIVRGNALSSARGFLDGVISLDAEL